MSAPRTSSLRPWVIGLGLVAAGLLVFLLVAETPDEAARESAERVAAGKKARPEADFATGLWWAAAVNLGIVVTLLVTLRLWARRVAEVTVGERGFAAGRVGRGFCLALLAIVVLGGAMRWNLAHRSLWWDELWGVKYGAVGYYLGDPKEPLEDRYFGEADWRRALWHYTRPINHPAATFPARLSHLVWRNIADPPAPNAFSDFAVRFPNWLAALSAVAAVGVVGALWGRPLAGLLAALVLALHPWHIRYGVDLRGYSWMVLWTAMGLLWLTLMFRQGRARWWPWWGFGLNQALLVWSFPLAAVVAAGFFAGAAVLAFWTGRDRKSRMTALTRLMLVNVAAAMLYLQLFAPNLLQAARWFDAVNANHQRHGLDAALAREFLGRWFTGLPWALGKGEDSAGLVDLLSGRAGGSVMLLWALLGALAAGLGIGAAGLARRDRTAAIALGSVAAAGAGMLAIFWVSQGYFYPRFLVFLVVPFALLLGWAADWKSGWRRGPVVAGMLALGLFGWLAMPQWKVLMARPYSPLRDVAEAFARIEEEADGPVIFACYGHGMEMLPIYFPELRSAASPVDLEALADEARSRGARLVVTYGHSSFNRVEVPNGFTWLDDAERFGRIGAFAGIAPEFTYRVLVWKEGE